MKYSMLIRGLSVCLLVAAGYAAPVSADWYTNDPQLNRNQGFGDFPPATIEQELDQKLSAPAGPGSQEPQQYQDSNPWDSGKAPVDHTPRPYSGSISQPDSQPQAARQAPVEHRTSPLGNIYQPAPYPAQSYDAYMPNPAMGGVPYGGSGPWNNRGSGYQVPWNNNGSGFSPWGGRGSRYGNNNPFGMSGPGSWFN